MNYDYGNKAQWRRHVWNRVAERTPKKDGLVLFLAGKDALDVEVAKRKGFRCQNMIAIERDRETLRDLRSNGKLAIDGDLFATLASWPNDRKVAVIFADLCGGLSTKAIRGLVQTLQHPAFVDTTFAVNLLRGRDDAAEACVVAKEYSPEIVSAVGEKHRGAAFAATFAAVLSCGVARAAAHRGDDEDEFFQRAHPLMLRKMNAAFYSYRSTAGNQWFDTAVFCHPFRGEPEAAVGDWRSEDYDPAQRRRIAATLAHHTMRSAHRSTI